MYDFQQSLLFSMVLSISFGPIALIILRQSIFYGRLSAVPSALGAAVADVLYAAVALLSAAVVKVLVFENRDLLVVVSIAYLFYLGIKIFTSIDPGMSTSKRAGFISVFTLTMTNPLTIVAITSYALTSHSDVSTINVAASLAGFFFGSFVCQMVYVLGGDAVGKLLSGKVSFRILNGLSGICLIVFALWKFHYFIKEKGLLWGMG